MTTFPIRYEVLRWIGGALVVAGYVASLAAPSASASIHARPAAATTTAAMPSAGLYGHARSGPGHLSL